MGQYTTVQEVIDDQNNYPVWIVNQTCDNLLDNTPNEGRDVLDALGLGYSEDKYGFYPLTEDELVFIGEDTVCAPYGGALTGPAYLYKGKKYIGVDIEVCYDGPNRPFSVESYGDSFYPNADAALAEAQRLADFLGPKLAPVSGMAHVIPGEPDRHSVIIMLPPAYLIDVFGKVPGNDPFKLFKNYIFSLFNDYEVKPPNA